LLKNKIPAGLRMIGYLWILAFAAAISRFVIAYYQSEITHDLSVPRTFLSFTWSFNLALAALCSPLGGRLTDKYGPKKVMVWSSLLGILSLLTVLVFRNAAGFFIGLGILSGLAGIGATTGYVLVTRWFKTHRAKALLFITSANSLGLAVLTPIFVENRSWLDWMNAYTITLWIGVISIPFTLWLIRDQKEGERGEERAEGRTEREESAAPVPEKISIIAMYAEYVKNPVTVVVMFALFTCGFSMGTVEMHLIAIHQHAHVGTAMFSTSLSLLGVLELGGGLLFAFLLDRLSRTGALACLYILRIIAFTALFFHFGLSPLLFSVIFGASYLGAIPGGLLVAGESLGESSAGLQSGTLLVFHQAGAVVAALSGGLLYDATNSYQLLLAVNIVLSAISAVGYGAIHVSRKSKRKREATAYTI
jgi:MFS family permease